MSIESLFGKEKPNSQSSDFFTAIPEYIERYRSLRNSVFYDSEMNAWRFSIWPTKGREGEWKPRDYTLPTSSQLLGILAEDLEDPATARIRYETLKRSLFFNQTTALWGLGHIDEGGWVNWRYTVNNQHLGVICEASFDLDAAVRRYNFLKKTPMYNVEKNQWYNSIDYSAKGEVPLDQKTDPFILSDVLIEGLLFGVDVTRKNYDQLKSLYMEEELNWLDQPREGERVDTGLLLSKILLEVVFDKDSAREHFSFFKNTYLYDPQKKLWFRWWQTEGQGERDFAPGVCDSDDQLLSILIEGLLADR